MTTVQILGTGCKKCQQLGQVAEQAARDLGLEFTLSKVTSVPEIMRFGVVSTPALVVDGQVRLTGRVPSLDEAKALLQATA